MIRAHRDCGGCGAKAGGFCVQGCNWMLTDAARAYRAYEAPAIEETASLDEPELRQPLQQDLEPFDIPSAPEDEDLLCSKCQGLLELGPLGFDLRCPRCEVDEL